MPPCIGSTSNTHKRKCFGQLTQTQLILFVFLPGSVLSLHCIVCYSMKLDTLILLSNQLDAHICTQTRTRCVGQQRHLWVRWSLRKSHWMWNSGGHKPHGSTGHSARAQTGIYWHPLTSRTLPPCTLLPIQLHRRCSTHTRPAHTSLRWRCEGFVSCAVWSILSCFFVWKLSSE